MFKKLLELGQIHGDGLTVEILEKAGIAKKDIPRILHDIIAKNDEANIYLILFLDRTLIDLYYLNEEGLTPLQVAVKLKRWDHVLAIVNAIEDVDHVKACSGYALLEAVKANEALIVALILKSCNDVSFQSPDNGYTALHHAIANNNEVILKALLANGINPNLRVRQTLLPLQMVLRAKVVNPKLIAILCQYGAEIASVVLPIAEARDWSLVQLILENNKPDEPILASNLLYEAVSQNNQAMVAYLLTKGADFTKGKAAIQRALDLKYFYFVSYAMDAAPSRELPLARILPIVAQAEEWDLVVKIIHAGPNFNTIINNAAVIHTLIAKEKFEILELLLKKGADVNLASGDNKAPIEMAVSQGATQAVKLLCQHGAGVESVVSNASQQKRWPDIKMILDSDQRNHGHLLASVLVPAAQAGEADMVSLLLSRGAKIEEAIKLAAQNKQWQALKRLITVSPTKNPDLLTSLLTTVIENDLPELLTFMLEQGASAITEISDKHKAVEFATYKSKWNCVVAIAHFLKSDPDDQARLAHALLLSAKSNQWAVVKTLCENGASLHWRFHDTGKFAAHFAIDENQMDVLTALLLAGFDANSFNLRSESVLECAERHNNFVAKNLLIQHGANHHNKLIREAEKSNWDTVLNLLSEYYEILPNQNETEADKKIIVGKLLHIAVTKESIDSFRALLLLGPDILQEYNNKSLLSLIVKAQAWDALDVLIAENIIQQFSKPAISAAMLEIYAAESNFKPRTMLCTFADLTYVEPSTGNSFVHLAIMHDWPNTVKNLIENKAPTNIKNAKGQLPITFLLELIKKGKVTKGDELVACFPAIQEYADALNFEKIGENLQEKNIEKSRDLSRDALLRRYPKFDVGKCIKEYRTFLGHLPDEYQRYKENSEYKLDDLEVRKDVALAWMGACDENALPECEAAIKTDPVRIKKFIEVRKLALAEKLYQARVETRESVGSCGNGTKTKAIESLNHAHPDVMICYSKSLTEESAREHALPVIRKKAQELLETMNFKEQRAFAREYFSEDDDNGELKLKLYKELSVTAEAALRPLYGELLPGDELKKLVSVENLQEIEFTPIQELGEVIFKIGRLKNSESNNAELAVLQQQASNAFDLARDESLFTELVRLKKSYRAYTDKVSAQQLASFSVLNSGETKQAVVEPETVVGLSHS